MRFPRKELYSFLRMRTEGTALFLTELLEEMEKDGTLRCTDGCWQLAGALEDSLPESIEAVLEGRLNATRLGDDAHAALITASVEGKLFAAQTIARVRQITDLEANHLLEEHLGQRHRVVRFDSHQEVPAGILDRYSFRHGLFQDYLYQRLGRGQRRLLHAGIGEALEGLYTGTEDRVALELARHFREAQDWHRLGKYALAAAKLQARAYAFKEAKSWCEEGLRAARRLVPSEQDRLVSAGLLLELGQAEERLSGIEPAIAQYRQAEQILNETGDTALLARTHFLLGEALYETKQWEESTEYLLKSLDCREYLQEGEDCAEVLKTLRFIFKKTPDRGYKDFLGLCDALIAMNDQKHDSLANVDVLESMGFAYSDMGLVDQAVRAWTAALQIAKEFNDRIRETRMLRRTGCGLRELRRFEESLASYTQSRSMALELRRPDMEILALDGMAQTYRQMGELEEALKRRQEQLETARKIGDIAAEAIALRTLGYGLSKLGRKEEARERYREALDICVRYGLVRGIEMARNNLAAILKHRGRFAEALTVFERLQETGRVSNDLDRVSISLNHIGDIYRIQGRAQEALECHQQVLEMLSSKEYQEYLLDTPEATAKDEGGRAITRQALTLRYLSAAYSELGEWDEASKCCAKSVEIWASRGNVAEEGSSLAQMGCILLASGDIEAAIETLSNAVVMLEKVKPESAGDAMIGLALAYIAQGDRRKALSNAWEAVCAFESIDSYRLGDARLALAKAYHLAGDTGNAVEWANLARHKFTEMGLEHRVKGVDAFSEELSSA